MTINGEDFTQWLEDSQDKLSESIEIDQAEREVSDPDYNDGY
jgi:hypothetical protein